MKNKHYLLAVSPGPTMVLRVPWPMPRWSDIVRATTPVMKAHNLRQKDLSSLEGLVVDNPRHRNDDDRTLVTRIDRGFLGFEGVVPQFWLYDWRDGAFQLARCGNAGGSKVIR